MKPKVACLLFALFIVKISLGQTANDLVVMDTRNTNEPPNTFGKLMRFDFKLRNVIQAPGSGLYGSTMTIAQWVPDGSGNKNHQLHFNDGGIFFRSGGSNSLNWDGWKSVVMTDANGNVGIGTSAPEVKLDIQGGPVRINNPGEADIHYQLDGGNQWQVGINNAGNGQNNNQFFIYDTDYRFTVQRGTGFIGVSSRTPSARLHINQSSGAWNDGLRLTLGSKSWDMLVDSYGDRLLLCRGQSITDGISIYNGNVGIGVASATNKLDVNGTIHAREVKVDLTGWSDFVFHPSYQLKPLTEVEKFIKTNGHLEDIPSAEQIEKEGVNVGEMQKKLLQKVEELTLYTIEQNKKIEEQAKINAMLLRRIEEMENQIKKQ